MTKKILCCIVVILTGIGLSFAENNPAAPVFTKAPIIKASLFKNGLAMVTRRVDLAPGQEEILIKDNPNPIHGTFWVHSSAKVGFVFTNMDIHETKTVKPTRITKAEILSTLAGENVKLYIGGDETLEGKLVKLPLKTDNMLVLKTSKGLEFIDFHQVRRFSLKKKTVNITKITKEPIKKTLKHKINVIKIKLPPGSGTGELTFSYLTRGITWAPAYKLNLTGRTTAALGFNAVLKNELADLHHTKIELISGFPAIKFEHVTSPLSASVTLNKYFSQLSSRHSGYNSLNSQIVTQNVVYNVSPPRSGPSGSNVLSNTDMDIHFREIGSLDITKGQSMLIQLGENNVNVEKLIMWSIAPVQDQYGRFQSSSNRKKSPGIWDAYMFKNPFTFPMTTAPITLYRDGRLYSQNISYWTPPGQTSTVKFSKALDIAADSRERELQGKRKTIEIEGDDFRKSIIEGIIEIRNLRNRTEKISIQKEFWGKLMDTQRNPQKQLLPEGVFSVNEKNRLTWEFTMKPGEKIKITYHYSVLVDI